jgi:predicted signal transduction protein with EAL and GGDEF domain
MSDARSAAVAKLRELRRLLGARPVVEDFGTVYTSLSHLGAFR